MQINKSLLVAGAVATMAALSVAGVAQAETNGATLVDKLAQRFNLNKEDVQKVFNEDHEAHKAQMEKRYEERLTQAVADGKITQEQKAKILAKHKELMATMKDKFVERAEFKAEMKEKGTAEMKALKDEHRAEMEKHRQEIEQWEKDNGIPSGYLFGPGGHGKGHVVRMMHKPF